MAASSGGKLTPLLIKAYSDSSLGTEVGQFTVLFNPAKYSHSYSVVYSDKQASGSSNTTLKFDKMPPAKVNFELVFDNTGVAVANQGSPTGDLPAMIKKFKDLLYEYKGEIHRPNYLKLSWGAKMTFQCVLTSLKIEYTLFKSNGTPVRAKATVEFMEFESITAIANSEQQSSPDMTHIRTVKAGDTLPAMTHGIYGDTKYYLQVAEFNNLDDFRNLIPGTQLVFPALKTAN